MAYLNWDKWKTRPARKQVGQIMLACAWLWLRLHPFLLQVDDATLQKHLEYLAGKGEGQKCAITATPRLHLAASWAGHGCSAGMHGAAGS